MSSSAIWLREIWMIGGAGWTGATVGTGIGGGSCGVCSGALAWATSGLGWSCSGAGGAATFTLTSEGVPGGLGGS